MVKNLNRLFPLDMGTKHSCFPMPPIPIVLKHSFLFLLACTIIWMRRLKIFLHAFR
ncbi:hypothetical protein PR202_ga20285 [Eleusine coracana subsp. coracana]|uniref:Uncharacterized protein n=1 Tax=Eleusine coracana subsp. coracana TaxID=191504 RepID=A0AAV5CW87_ELECO|nr:hypothetical protein PR202_ga20285 [Eleusine coracana subsp. coracana]